MKFLIILSCIALSKAQSLVEAQPEPISPYSFSYNADATDGSSTRQESADASGVVRGSYSLVSADGIKRIVNYIADENGFRAQVQTNEPGTESKSSADVIMQSSQLPAEEIALRVGPRPFEQKPEIQTFGVKGVEHKLVSPILSFKSVPRAILLKKPVVDHTLLQKKLETVEEVRQTIPRFPSFQLTSKQIETPIKLLSNIQKVNTFKTIGLDLQQKEEFVPQSFERY